MEDETKGHEGGEDADFRLFLEQMNTRFGCTPGQAWSRRVVSLGDECLLTIQGLWGHVRRRDDDESTEDCLRVMFFRPCIPHASLWKLDITADVWREHRRNLLIETSTSNFVVLMHGALSGASLAFQPVGGSSSTKMKLQYMPQGSQTKLVGAFTLDLVSDGIPSDMSELVFNLPTHAKFVKVSSAFEQQLQDVQAQLAKATRRAGGLGGAAAAGAAAPASARSSTAKRSTRRSRPVKRRRRGRGGAKIG